MLLGSSYTCEAEQEPENRCGRLELIGRGSATESPCRSLRGIRWGRIYTVQAEETIYVASQYFVPIVKAATGDYWLKSSADAIFGDPPKHNAFSVKDPTQQRLLEELEDVGDLFKTSRQAIIHYLPDRDATSQEKHVDRGEVAVNLINMWICDIAHEKWPGYHLAEQKAAHLLSVGHQALGHPARALPIVFIDNHQIGVQQPNDGQARVCPFAS